MILCKGHSRVPIYSNNPTNIIGLILVKNLIKYRAEEEVVMIRDLNILSIPRFEEEEPLYDILNQFQKGQSHMGVVIRNAEDPPDSVVISMESASPSMSPHNERTEIVGIITMEDVLEHLLQEPIFDETDEFRDIDGDEL
ncbi:hypothetical protein M569_12519 [Genlisea aurea]|uniref:CBS domain-containing protein n=1 Tax=Genlisea aurea TaxID=192259 RepID=S8DR27_9LAMI|nr:hypothetical protein M569_12519 [Genlisea aurea]